MQEYMIDTNAYFKVLCYLNGKVEIICEEYSEEIDNIIRSNCCISKVTLIEIVSVIGKYARGNEAQRNKCNCTISDNGEKCQNYRYIEERKKWKTKEIKAWLKLTKDIVSGRSELFRLNVIDLSNDIFIEAEKFIQHSLKHNFGSMDSLIAATAINEQKKGKKITVITSDKSLKAGMELSGITYCDTFKDIRYSYSL